MTRAALTLLFGVAGLLLATDRVVGNSQGAEDYLTWSAKTAESIGSTAYRRGRVGGAFDLPRRFYNPR